MNVSVLYLRLRKKIEPLLDTSIRKFFSTLIWSGRKSNVPIDMRALSSGTICKTLDPISGADRRDFGRRRRRSQMVAGKEENPETEAKED